MCMMPKPARVGSDIATQAREALMLGIITQEEYKNLTKEGFVLDGNGKRVRSASGSSKRARIVPDDENQIFD